MGLGEILPGKPIREGHHSVALFSTFYVSGQQKLVPGVLLVKRRTVSANVCFFTFPDDEKEISDQGYQPSNVTGLIRDIFLCFGNILAKK